MLKLSNVTIIALTGKNVESHERALEYSCKGIEFGDAKVVYDSNIKNIDDWNHAVVFNLGQYVYTDYALLIHDNGFVVNPECWNDKWLEYDYCGSPWPLPVDDYSYKDINGVVQRVGNSVGLRSKKLLDIPRKIEMPWASFYGNTNEDGAICVNYRHLFEKEGCKFMPLKEAVYFGRENDIEENLHIDKTFIFHNFKGRNAKYKNLI